MALWTTRRRGALRRVKTHPTCTEVVADRVLVGWCSRPDLYAMLDRLDSLEPRGPLGGLITNRPKPDGTRWTDGGAVWLNQAVGRTGP